MDKKEIQKLCQWAYHRGRVGMVENIYNTLKNSTLTGEPLIDLVEHIIESEKKDLEKAEKELDNGV